MIQINVSIFVLGISWFWDQSRTNSEQWKYPESVATCNNLKSSKTSLKNAQDAKCSSVSFLFKTCLENVHSLPLNSFRKTGGVVVAVQHIWSVGDHCHFHPFRSLIWCHQAFGTRPLTCNRVERLRAVAAALKPRRISREQEMEGRVERW